jgi:hypothetical protein
MEIDPGDECERRLCRHIFGLKIGRTCEVDERCKTLARSMPFKMKVLAEFPEAADLEHKIYEFIRDKQNNKGLRPEWFHVDVGEEVVLMTTDSPANCSRAEPAI